MKNILILGVFAAAVVLIGGNKFRHRISELRHDNVVTVNIARNSGGDFHWTGHLNPGNVVEIKGINGDIHAERASGDQVEVRAQMDSRSSDASDVRVEVVQYDGGVTLCAVYPSRGSRQNRCAPGDGGHLSSNNNNTEVEFTVYVPDGVRFNARTINGDVDASGLTAQAYAKTTNGDVILETTGYGEAETVNGDVFATVGDVSGGMHFSSVNGDLMVNLPSNIDAELLGNTVSGDISSDFDVTVRGQFGPKNFSGLIGSGGNRIQLESVNGDIVVRRHR